MELKKTILIVDDEYGPRESLKMVLDHIYKVELAENGTKALEIIDKKEINLVTLDLNMPELHGEEVLRRIKKHNSGIEVLIVTGCGTRERITNTYRDGASGFISKPFDYLEIQKKIASVLDSRAKMEKWSPRNV